MIDLAHYLAGFNGFDLLLALVIFSGLGFSLINEIRGIRKMSKYEEMKTKLYNGCGHVFLFIVSIKFLGFLIDSENGGSNGEKLSDLSILGDYPILSGIIALVVVTTHVLAFIGSLNIAERLNNMIKPVL